MNYSSATDDFTDVVHEILRNFPYALYVVGVGVETEESNALVVSWITQCSFEPPMLAVAIRKDSLSSRLIRESAIFSVNLLRPDQDELARKAVRPAHMVENKMDDIGTTVEKTGVPLLEEAMAFLECRVRGIVETGDHHLVIGEVVNAGGEITDNVLMCADAGWRYGG